MAEVSEAQLIQALSRVEVPQLGGDPVTRGLAGNFKICEGNVAFDLRVPAALAAQARQLEEQCRAAAQRVEGVIHVNVRLQVEQPTRPPAAPQAPPGSRGPGIVPGARHIIAVGSGKGGVGKSTVAVNLSVALAQQGATVGLLDADVYGPSIPTMMGVRQQPGQAGGKLIPLEQHGIKLMSLGFLLQADKDHVIWRGPMVGGAVRQMLADVDWGELDYLLVDLPPGTGDAQLTLAQSVPLTGAVVVMTSQDVAVNIASKAVGMFRTLKVPILGVVGNMDSFACPNCGVHTPIFTRGGSEAAAESLGVPFLGSIPLDPATVEHGDRGVPTVLAAAATKQAEAFREVARNVVEQVRLLDEGESSASNPLAGLLGRFKGGG